ncbi:MAG: dihydrofolate reductase family protein [Trueperaceae bacterium]
MRTIIADLFVTLDGFALGEKSPAYFGYFGPDLEHWINDELAKPQALLFGRVTYQMLAGMIQAATDEASRRMNALPKVVVSNTLQEPLEWHNTHLLKSTELQILKEQSGEPLRTMGSVSLVKSLLKLDLVDQLRLIIFPQILGETGREPLFSDLPDINLELLNTRVLDNRLMLVEYRPTKRPSAST